MDEFLEATGASGPLRLCVEVVGSVVGGSEPGARAFAQPFVVVGRDPRCDLVLEHPEVSPRHVYFQVVNGRVLYLDLGSRSGVSHAGKRRRVGWLAREESLRVGPYRVRLQGGDVAGEVPTGVPAADAPLAFEDARLGGALGLELSHRAVRRTDCEARWGLALIGSGADCPIRLIDPSVATYHAALIRTPAGAWVVDLLGEGGARHNGRAARSAKLAVGDALQLGHSVIRVTRIPTANPRPVPVPEPEPVPEPAPTPTPIAIEPAGDDAFVFGSKRAVRASVEPSPQSHSDAAMIATARAMERVEGVLAPMVRQFALMQEQMVGEYHQARTALYETLTALHQEQSAVFEHELDQLRQLAQDLTRLRADLERARQAEPVAAPAPTVPRETTSSLRIPAASASNKAVVGPSAVVLDEVARERVAPGVLESPPRVHDENVHNQLCDRMVQIREEPLSRWRKLLGLLPGAASTGRSTP